METVEIFLVQRVMLSHHFRSLDKSRQSITTLLAFEAIHNHGRILPQIYHRPVIAAAVTTWNPSLIKSCISVLLDNSQSADGQAYEILSRYASKLSHHVWWQRMIQSIVEDSSLGNGGNLDHLSPRKRRLLRSLVSAPIAPSSTSSGSAVRSKDEPTDSELLAEKKLGINLRTISRFENLLVAHGSEGEEESQEGNIAKTFRSLLPNASQDASNTARNDHLLARTRAISSEIDDILDRASSPLPGRGIDSIAPKPLADHDHHDDENTPLLGSYQPTISSQFLSKQRKAHRLLNTIPQYLTDASIDSLVSEFRAWNTHQRHTLSSSPSGSIATHENNIDDLALTVMSWYTRAHLHHHTFDFQEFLSQFSDFHPLLPRLYKRSKSFAAYVTSSHGHREQFLTLLESILESGRSSIKVVSGKKNGTKAVVKEADDVRGRKIRLTAELIATAAAVITAPQQPLEWFTRKSVMQSLRGTFLHSEDLIEALAQAVLVEKKALPLFQHHLNVTSASSKANLNNESCTSSSGTGACLSAVSDLVARRQSSYAYVKALSQLRQQQGQLIDKDHFDLLFSFIHSFKVDSSNTTGATSEAVLQQVKARHLITSGLFQPHRIIEAMAIESSWNYETTLSANLLAQLLKLTNKSLQTMLTEESNDCELVIAFMKRLATQWEDSLLIPPYSENSDGTVVSGNTTAAMKEHRAIVEEVVKFYCVCNEIDKAKHLLMKTMKSRDAVLYEPLIYCIACVQNQLDEAKILVSHMLSLGMAPTRKIIDSIIKGYFFSGRPIEALDAAVELYQQHRVQPSPVVFDLLTQAARKANDEHEVARIVYTKSVIFPQKSSKSA